jgi:hypothetical protein
MFSADRRQYPRHPHFIARLRERQAELRRGGIERLFLLKESVRLNAEREAVLVS